MALNCHLRHITATRAKAHLAIQDAWIYKEVHRDWTLEVVRVLESSFQLWGDLQLGDILVWDVSDRHHRALDFEAEVQRSVRPVVHGC